MSVERSVAELKAAAARVLERVELESVYLMRSDYKSAHRTGEISLVSAYAIKTRVERSESVLRSWVQHTAWALAIDDETEVPETAGEVPSEFVDEHFAWQSETEWVVEFASTEGNDLTDLPMEDCSAFSMVMGPPTAHPYARELIQSLSERGLYPALSLGLITPLTQMSDDEVIEIVDD